MFSGRHVQPRRAPRAARPSLLPLPQAVMLACLSLGLASTTPPVSAQTAAAPVAYAIAAGPLDQALNQYAARAGILLAIDGALTAGKTSPGLSGNPTIPEGLAALLAGTGLEAVRGTGGEYVLREAPRSNPPITMLREVRVSAAALRDGETEGSGSYTTPAITIGKTAQALREHPQSVSVLTRDRLDDQNITDLGRAAEQAVGITVVDFNYRMPAIYSRGFEIDSVQLDGGAPMFTGHYSGLTYDMAEYDRVEILRGAAGLLNGAGNPGGAVNLVRKMPTTTPQFSVTASLGRWQHYRTELDASGPLAYDGKLRGRAVVSYEDRHFFNDRSSRTPLVYGVLEADLGPNVVVALGMRDKRLNERGMGVGLPRYRNGDDIGLPRDTNLTTDWASMEGYSREVFAKLSWRLADRWTLRMNAMQARQHSDAQGAFGLGAVDPLTGQGNYWGGTPTRSWNKQNLIDVNLSGAFDLFGRTHEVLVGADMQDITSRWLGSTFNHLGDPVNIYDPSSTPWHEPQALPWWRDYSPNSQRQYGAYGTLRLEVADRTKVIVGARINRFTYDQVYRERDFTVADSPWELASATSYSEPTRITPFAGVVYDLNHQWTAYASYAQIFKPQADRKAGPAPGTGLDPMRGTNIEVGVKGELMNGQLNTALALYRIVQDKRAVADPRYPAESVLWAGSCCFLASGKVVSQGVDMEVNGEVARGINLYAGYTYNNNRNKSTDLAFSTITPKHLLKLWGTWQLPGKASAWKVGGGATIQSRQYVSGTAATWNAASGLFNGPNVPFQYSQGGHAVWNAMVEYRYDDHWTLTANVNNLFDKRYYRTVGSSVLGNYYGEPRNVMLTLRGRW